LDVSDTVGGDFDGVLLELLFCGALRDHRTGRSLHLDLSRTYVCIELGASHLLSTLHCCQFLAHDRCLPGFRNFCVERAGLEVGMGRMFHDDVLHTNNTWLDNVTL
jgi:hypothetical protein